MVADLAKGGDVFDVGTLVELAREQPLAGKNVNLFAAQRNTVDPTSSCMDRSQIHNLNRPGASVLLEMSSRLRNLGLQHTSKRSGACLLHELLVKAV